MKLALLEVDKHKEINVKLMQQLFQAKAGDYLKNMFFKPQNSPKSKRNPTKRLNLKNLSKFGGLANSFDDIDEEFIN